MIERIDIAGICTAYGVTKQTVYAYRRNDTAFPAPFRIPRNPRQFDKQEIEAYFAAKDCRHDLPSQ